jgi:hypothetical protein
LRTITAREDEMRPPPLYRSSPVSLSLKSSNSLRHTYARTPRSPRATVALARASYAASLLLALLAAAPLAAQQAPATGNANANGDAYANAPPAAANRAANDRLRGVGDEDSLLGAPAAYRDPYRSALNAGDMQQSDLMRAERVPNGVANGNGYDPLPPGGGKPVARAAGAGGGADAGGGGGGGGGGAPGVAGNAPGGNAAPNTAQAAQPLYRDPFGGAKGNGGQVYRSPW